KFRSEHCRTERCPVPGARFPVLVQGAGCRVTGAGTSCRSYLAPHLVPSTWPPAPAPGTRHSAPGTGGSSVKYSYQMERRIIVGITGATGVVYGVRLL